MTTVLKHLRSIRGRITLAATTLVAITLVVASVVLMQWVQADLLASAQDTLDRAMEAQADRIGQLEDQAEAFGIGDFPVEQALEASVDGREVFIGLFEGFDEDLAIGEMRVDGEPVANLLIDVESGDIAAVYDLSMEQQLTDPVLLEQIQSLAFEVIELTGDDDEQDRFLVGVASLDEVEESVAAIGSALRVIVPALVLAFGLLIWWMVGRALRPVMSITNQVEAISSSSLDRRVPVPDTNDEVADLALVMNHMLDRLQRGGERQRQFSADASHELRSPLSTVRAAAEWLGQDPSRERAERLSADIVAESDRMDELITDLLELSRLDEDRRAPDADRVDLVALVERELASELAAGLLTVDAPPRVPTTGSPRQLRRLVRNLVDNALRHADGTVVVTVASNDGQSRLAVDDDGGGVPDEAKQAIFERFSRLDDARGRDAGGSGLGLALVRAIAEAHRASVTVEDSHLGGARFVVELPGPDSVEKSGSDFGRLDSDSDPPAPDVGRSDHDPDRAQVVAEGP